MRQRLRLITPGISGTTADSADPHNNDPEDLDGRPPVLLGSGRRAGAEARVSYLFLRHGIYYFKRKVPSDVRHGFPEFRSGQLVRSLGTGLLSQAKVLLAVEVTEFELRVAQIRRELAQQQALARAAQARESYERRAPHVERGPHAAAKPSVNGAFTFSYQLPWGTAAAWPALNTAAPFPQPQVANTAAAPSAQAATRHASRRPQSATAIGPRVVPTSTAGTKPKAPPVDASGPAINAATNAARNPTTSPTTAPATVRIRRDAVAASTTMLHLYESWKLTQTRARTLGTVHTSVMEFRTLHGPLPVAAVTKTHARAYRDLLIERGLSKRTIENKLGHLSTLVRFGMRELIEDHPLNPFERIDIIGATGLHPPKDRRAYTVAELNTILGSQLYTTDYRPGGQVTDAAYWLPIFGPFVGARIEELCQLRVEDVQRINGSWCIRICDLGDDQTVKTLSSFRRVPLHEVIIRSGFLAYAARMAAAGHDRVFPTLSNDNATGTYSNAAGKWYARYLDIIGLTDRRLDYHSYRYTLRQQMSLCGTQNETRDALTGHWLSNTDSGRTYMKAEQRQYPYPLLAEAVGKLHYDGLKVEHLYVDDPLQGTERLLGN